MVMFTNNFLTSKSGGHYVNDHYMRLTEDQVTLGSIVFKYTNTLTGLTNNILYLHVLSSITNHRELLK